MFFPNEFRHHDKSGAVQLERSVLLPQEVAQRRLRHRHRIRRVWRVDGSQDVIHCGGVSRLGGALPSERTLQRSHRRERGGGESLEGNVPQ